MSSLCSKQICAFQFNSTNPRLSSERNTDLNPLTNFLTLNDKRLAVKTVSDIGGLN